MSVFAQRTLRYRGPCSGMLPSAPLRLLGTRDNVREHSVTGWRTLLVTVECNYINKLRWLTLRLEMTRPVCVVYWSRLRLDVTWVVLPMTDGCSSVYWQLSTSPNPLLSSRAALGTFLSLSILAHGIKLQRGGKFRWKIRTVLKTAERWISTTENRFYEYLGVCQIAALSAALSL